MVIEKTQCFLQLSRMDTHNRLRLLALASLLLVGCSSYKPYPPKAVERDPCLDAGPVKSQAFDRCVADREARQKVALSALLDDGPSHEKALVIVDLDEEHCTKSLSPAEEQALPLSVIVSWKFSSETALPTPEDAARMKKMEALLLPAIQEKGLAKWLCTITSEHQREWLFLTRNHEDFFTQARTALNGTYPIEMRVNGAP
ncbi:DUF695 domain-containing protein [Pseudomonas sp. SAICEU22]|uniref:DUF695 domain-containing protein n=1 Tax=Pseudomonas agronomica TaxID=2979328 RepID=A0ABT3FH42_9PSED|nr:DUF695 domain-containing protein [Pseudomonas agronomica]MCW1248169.1 DUF695 domain-containing protein [Pseudomonas agronomica]